jgi:hypothetical protein
MDGVWVALRGAGGYWECLLYDFLHDVLFLMLSVLVWFGLTS